MNYSKNTEKLVVSFSKLKDIYPLPDLLELQKKSFERFLNEGLRELLESIFPVYDHTGTISLHFIDYSFGEPKYTVEEARNKHLTYSKPLKIKFELHDKKTGEIKEQEVVFGDFPIMDENGTFIINGAERAVVSQLIRSPGVYFQQTGTREEGRSYTARIIPNRGVWIDFELDVKGVIYVKLEKIRKIPATLLLKALGYGTNLNLYKLFGSKERFVNPTVSTLIGKIPEEDIVHPKTGDILVRAGEIIDSLKAEKILKENIKRLELWSCDDLKNTLEKDETTNSEEALIEFYKRLRPGEPPTKESAENLIKNLFFEPRRYDLGEFGRYKINKKFGKEIDENSLKVRNLTREDFLEVVKYLIKLSKGEGSVDDIDHLGNRRVRPVGELLQNHLRSGFLRVVRGIEDKMMALSREEMTPYSLINVRPITAALNEFFGTGQLSQFMDQTNPLSELTHKRRISALGPGGLTRERAGIEVRDVHYSHYGRICPIETPEGPNIGLINSLCTYARVNRFGFIETPYRKVKNGRVTDEVIYLSADEEEKYRIAQANTPVDNSGKLIEEKVAVRYGKENLLVSPEEVDFMDVSPKQIVSVSTSLIPFLEHDDANRALMGSNMQRQAVSLLIPEAPLVQTGIEERVAKDSGAVIVAKNSGIVRKVSSSEIVIETEKGKEVYPLRKFGRSNQGTCINYRPVVKIEDKVKKGEIIADGSCSDRGKIALGKNVLVAFMPWRGYNFEDAVVISERLLKEDVFTSIHIEEYETEARDTKLGPEEITRDIPNISEEFLKNLDERGIIMIGAEVKPDDILVGKVTPKGEEELTAEEKLLRAIFGEKAKDIHDTSLRVSPGVRGKVIDVKVFSRKAGDDLPAGVNTLVRVYIAQKRKIQEGDKVAGRHGNKGVVSVVCPEEDMPYLPDGTPVDIVFNTLGVPSRMNVGQILETHLGYVAKVLGLEIVNPIFDGAKEEEIKFLLGISKLLKEGEVCLYDNRTKKLKGILCWEEDKEIERMFLLEDSLAEKVIDFIKKNRILLLDPSRKPIALLDFKKKNREEIIKSWERCEFLKIADITIKDSQYSQKEIKEILENCFFKNVDKTILYDGMTGEPFDQPITVGYLYVMKLTHLVEAKLHARSTGPYALVTQQPLGGKAQFGGQRLGEMEVWALEAYGAAYTLQELLTVKSDDMAGRVKTYESIVKGGNIFQPSVPESFKVLVKELQGLGIDVKLLKDDKTEIKIPEGEDVTEVTKFLEKELI